MFSVIVKAFRMFPVAGSFRGTGGDQILGKNLPLKSGLAEPYKPPSALSTLISPSEDAFDQQVKRILKPSEFQNVICLNPTGLYPQHC